MKSIKLYRALSILIGSFILILTLGCERIEEGLRPATFPNTAEIFIDGFSAGLEYAAFGDSKLTAFTVDENVSYEDVIGTSSMRFDIPNEGDPEGPYAGGIFRDLGGRNLTEYDALTFYAKASKAATVDLIGFGADFMGDKYLTSTSLKLSTSWTKYIIPIPDPAKLTQLKGLFGISEGPEDGDGYSLWLDIVKFEKLGTLAHPRPAILNGEDITQRTFIGVTSALTGLTQTMNLPNGSDQSVNVAPAYFEFNSSDTTVAKVDELGMVSIVGEGTAKITALMGSEDAAGSLNIESLGEFTAAPEPPHDQSDVISIFSDAYENVPVDFYNGFFEPFQRTKGGADIVINNNTLIRYYDLNFVATEFKNPTVNATDMTHFHVDIQIENPIEAEDFITIQLGDFGPDGEFGGDDDASGEVVLNTSPPLVSNEWISLDIPLSDFTGLTSRANLAQIFFITDGSVPVLPGTITEILVDNMYFYKLAGGGPIPPTSPAPTPTEDAANVISIYSDAYTNVPNEGYNLYGAAAFEEVPISGNNALKYTFVAGDGGNYQVIELGGDNQIDAEAAGMTNFRFDVWFPNAVNSNSAFLMKLADIPASGTTEGQINISPSSNPEMVQGSWLSYDIPFTELESNGLGGKSSIQQIVIDLLNSGEVYIDNIYLYKSGGGATEPTVAAPTPTQDAANVISVYSDAYTDISGTNFNPDWGQATVVSEVQIEGNNTQLYTGLDFQGIQLGSSQDVSGMEFLHIDYWTVSSTALNSFLISTGPVETGKALTVPTTGWNSVDIPLSDFSLVDLADVIQFKFDGNGDIYLDNIYFYKTGGGASEPTVAAPTPPARDGADVISLFSNAYTNETVDTWSADWDDSSVEDVQIAGDDVKKYTFTNFAGIDFSSNKLNATDMTNFHVDIWTPNEVLDKALSIKNVDFGGGNAEASSHTLTVTHTAAGDVPALAQGSWVSIDVPISAFTGDLTRSDLAQMVLTSGMQTLYIDNIYFYKSGGGTCEDPTAAPPTPSQDAADVISVFSDAYTDIANTNFNPGWGQTTVVTTESIGGESTFKYDIFNFQGTNLGGADGVDQDLSSMEYLHIDMWTCDATVVEVTPISRSTGEKLVSLTPISNGQWNSYDIPLSDFTGVSMADIYQMKFDGQKGTSPSKIFVDNIYFYKTGGGPANGPSEAAPTPPSRDAANVVSIYSDAYTDITTDNFDAGWCGGAAVTGVTIAGNNTLKKNTGIDCHGIDFSTKRQDLSSYTHLHFDFYTDDTDLTGDVFNVKLVDFAGGGGEASALEVNINTGTSPAIVAGTWVSVDIDITSLGGIVVGSLTRSDIAQIGITTANLTNVWYDNIYLYK